MPRRFTLCLRDQTNKMLVERAKANNDRSETDQIDRYISLGEEIYKALDRKEVICFKKPDGTIQEIEFGLL